MKISQKVFLGLFNKNGRVFEISKVTTKWDWNASQVKIWFTGPDRMIDFYLQVW